MLYESVRELALRLRYEPGIYFVSCETSKHVMAYRALLTDELGKEFTLDVSNHDIAVVDTKSKVMLGVPKEVVTRDKYIVSFAPRVLRRFIKETHGVYIFTEPVVVSAGSASGLRQHWYAVDASGEPCGKQDKSALGFLTEDEALEDGINKYLL